MGDDCKVEGIAGKNRDAEVGLMGAKGPKVVAGDMGERAKLNLVGSRAKRSWTNCGDDPRVVLSC